MGQDRFNLFEAARPVPVQVSAGVAGFVAVPLCLIAGAEAYQSQLYQWAYRQAQAAVAARTARTPDLFAVFN
jgi:hypothetical protein